MAPAPKDPKVAKDKAKPPPPPGKGQGKAQGPLAKPPPAGKPPPAAKLAPGAPGAPAPRLVPRSSGQSLPSPSPQAAPLSTGSPFGNASVDDDLFGDRGSTAAAASPFSASPFDSMPDLTWPRMPVSRGPSFPPGCGQVGGVERSQVSIGPRPGEGGVARSGGFPSALGQGRGAVRPDDGMRICQAAAALTEQYILCERKVHCSEKGVDSLNRDGEGLAPSDVHTLASFVVDAGCDVKERCVLCLQ